MSWISRSVEQRLANAAESGELRVEKLEGKPIPGIDERRPDGWWAEQFVQRELSHDRRKVAVAVSASARAGFWRAETAEQLAGLVADANQQIVAANINLVDADHLERFELADIVARWHALRC